MERVPKKKQRAVKSRSALESYRPAPEPALQTRIVVVGVGGAGTRSLRRMRGEGLKGVELLAVDTDGAALAASDLPRRLRIGDQETRGLGSGGDASRGARAAEAAREEVRQLLGPADLVLVAAGLGGGTGSGAAPIIAATTREAGVRTVGVVTLPFAFEGARRRAVATAGLQAMKDGVDTLIVVASDRVLEIVDRRVGFQNAFRIVDDTVHLAVRCISDPVVVPGLLNLALEDVNAILAQGGGARLALGRGEGDDRARLAAQEAITCRLLDVPIDSATGILLNVTGGPDIALIEVKEALDTFYRAAGPEVNLLCGAMIDPAMEGKMRVTAVVMGMDGAPPTAFRLRGPRTPPEEGVDHLRDGPPSRLPARGAHSIPGHLGVDADAFEERL